MVDCPFRRILILVCILAILHCLPGRAALRVAAVFGDNAVLQREVALPVWGSAPAGTEIHIEFAGQSRIATADKNGKWLTRLEAMPASSEGRPLHIYSFQSRITFTNIVVGEVWLASGQSNMQFSMGACARRMKIIEATLREPADPNIRFLRISCPDSPSLRVIKRDEIAWNVDSQSTRPGYSAVAFFFARKVANHLRIPVGVIESSWGGKPIEGFIPEEEFENSEALRPIAKLARNNKLEEVGAMKGGVIIRNTAGMPGRIFNSRIAPIAPYAVAGAIWYQGESNAGKGEDPRNYRVKMQALVTGWRKAFRNPRLPFYFVQLPAYRDEAFGWIRLREEQRLSLSTPRTGMAVTIDLYDNDIHPANKIDVGERLALWPLSRQYGHTDTVCGGPLFKSAKVEGETIRIQFDFLGGGLMVATKEGAGPVTETPATDLQHFEIAGADAVWHPATAEIESEEVVVQSPSVNQPVAVRYACHGAPRNPNLYNRAGLPASPFCSNLAFLPWAANRVSSETR